jgi:hypothetical protein
VIHLVSSAKWGVYTYAEYAKYGLVTILHIAKGFTYYIAYSAYCFAYFFAFSADENEVCSYSAYFNLHILHILGNI